MSDEKKAKETEITFDAIKMMVLRDQDIGLATTLLRAQLVKQGAEVTMGVPAGWMHKMMVDGGYMTCLLVINAAQFDALKKELTVERDRSADIISKLLIIDLHAIGTPLTARNPGDGMGDIECGLCLCTWHGIETVAYSDHLEDCPVRMAADLRGLTK